MLGVLPRPLSPCPRGKALWPGWEVRADGVTWPGSSASPKALGTTCTSPTAAPSLPIPACTSPPASRAAELGSLPHRRDLRHLLEAQPAACSCSSLPRQRCVGVLRAHVPMAFNGKGWGALAPADAGSRNVDFPDRLCKRNEVLVIVRKAQGVPGGLLWCKR